MPVLTLALLLVASASPRARVVEVARSHLRERLATDCSGFVIGVFREAGVALPEATAARSRSEALYRAARRVRTPQPGDLAFFHNTYDRNRDGRADDLFTHIGIVERVRGSEVSVIHLGGSGVERIFLSLRHRGWASLNSVLRRPRPGDPPHTKYLAGQLLAGFASPRSPTRLARRP